MVSGVGFMNRPRVTALLSRPTHTRMHTETGKPDSPILQHERYLDLFKEESPFPKPMHEQLISFGFRFSGFRLRGQPDLIQLPQKCPCHRFRLACFRWVSDFGFRGSASRFRISVFGLKVQGLRAEPTRATRAHGISNLCFMFSGYRSRV